MGAFVVIGIVSPIAEGLKASKASAGMVLTGYAFAYALLSPVGAAMIYVGITVGSAIASAMLGSFGLAGLGLAGGIGALVALAHLLASQRLARPLTVPNFV